MSLSRLSLIAFIIGIFVIPSQIFAEEASVLAEQITIGRSGKNQEKAKKNVLKIIEQGGYLEKGFRIVDENFEKGKGYWVCRITLFKDDTVEIAEEQITQTTDTLFIARANGKNENSAKNRALKIIKKEMGQQGFTGFEILSEKFEKSDVFKVICTLEAVFTNGIQIQVAAVNADREVIVTLTGIGKNEKSARKDAESMIKKLKLEDGHLIKSEKYTEVSKKVHVCNINVLVKARSRNITVFSSEGGFGEEEARAKALAKAQGLFGEVEVVGEQMHRGEWQTVCLLKLDVSPNNFIAASNTCYKIEGQGMTIAEAKQNAIARVQELLASGYDILKSEVVSSDETTSCVLTVRTN